MAASNTLHKHHGYVPCLCISDRGFQGMHIENVCLNATIWTHDIITLYTRSLTCNQFSPLKAQIMRLMPR